jgi:type I restriction enzyme S subunit
MSGWTRAALGEVAEFVRGINFKPDDVVPVGTPDSVACMRTKNVQAELDLSDVWAVGESFVKRDEQFLRAGDILVSSANSWNLVGKCCWIPELPWRASFGGFVSVLRAAPAKVEPRYLFRWFSSERIQTTLRSFGQQTTNISNLNVDRCLKLDIPLPPLAEQRRIAEVLDRAEALGARRRAALAELDNLTQAIFLELFGDPAFNPRQWPRIPLVGLCKAEDDIRCGPFGTQLGKHEYTSEGVPLWGIKHVNALFELPTHEFLEAQTAKRLMQYSIEPGDIVMTRKGTVGNCAVYPVSYPIGIMHSDLLRLRVDREKCVPLFLAHQLHYSRDVERQLALISGGAIMPGINVTRLKSLEVLVPPVEAQREFERRALAVEKCKVVHSASLAEMDALFAALQHRAFRGGL